MRSSLTAGAYEAIARLVGTVVPMNGDPIVERAPSAPRGRVVLAAAVVAVVAAVVAATLVVVNRRPDAPGTAVGAVPHRLVLADPAPRDRTVYQGLGTWVDVYDYNPAHQSAGAAPAVGPTTVDAMAAAGVRTLFLQGARSSDDRAPGDLVRPDLLAEFLIRAHRAGVRVVGWYLPTFEDPAADSRRLAAIANFEVIGHRFDGVAVDIEANQTVPDLAERNRRLIDISTVTRAALGTDALGAIVPPPVQTEVINPSFWPAFPWRELAPLYDVWLPMAYWTFRKADSAYHDGYTYAEESTRRLRADLGDPAAAVHAIGGISDAATPDEIQRFVQSLVDTGAVGGSMYDWQTLDDSKRVLLRDAFASVTLPAPAG
jgi:hypothetical protein